MRYDLWGGTGTFRGAKVGFCFLDSDIYNSGLPGYSGGYYRGSMCSTTRTHSATGWGSASGWATSTSGSSRGNGSTSRRCHRARTRFARRSIRAAASRGGERQPVCVCDHQLHHRLERRDLEDEHRACINDWSGSTFAATSRGCSRPASRSGCGADLFCTHNPITAARWRHSSIARSTCPRPGPTSSRRRWRAVRDEHQPAAAAGITWGCGDRKYCPKPSVTRGEMAAFIERALRPAPTTNEYYPDDEARRSRKTSIASPRPASLPAAPRPAIAPQVGHARPDGGVPRPGPRLTLSARCPGPRRRFLPAAIEASMIRHASSSPSQPFTSVWRFSRVL